MSRRGIKKHALVIVHLSSLDAYTQAGHEIEGDTASGEDLAFWIEQAIMEHNGPVYIVDQGWSLGLRWSRPRARLLDAIRFRRGTVWIRFDEDTDDWDLFLRDLVRRLKRDSVTRVMIGGIWFDPELKEGCATKVYTHLRRHFKATVNPDIVGCVGGFEEPEPPEGISPTGPV